MDDNFLWAYNTKLKLKARCLLCLSMLSSVTHHAEHFDKKKQKPCWAGSSIVRGCISSKLPEKQESV